MAGSVQPNWGSACGGPWSQVTLYELKHDRQDAILAALRMHAAMDEEGDEAVGGRDIR